MSPATASPSPDPRTSATSGETEERTRMRATPSSAKVSPGPGNPIEPPLGDAVMSGTAGSSPPVTSCSQPFLHPGQDMDRGGIHSAEDGQIRAGEVRQHDERQEDLRRSRPLDEDLSALQARSGDGFDRGFHAPGHPLVLARMPKHDQAERPARLLGPP